MGGGSFLALDLASTTGWAEGTPGGRIASGVLRLGDPGASPAERYWTLFRWLWDRLGAFPPAAVWYEAPLPAGAKRGSTNADTAALLMGFPAVLLTACQARGIYRVEKANVQDVRQHFIGGRPFTFRGKPVVGRRNLESRAAKFCTAERCRELGWQPEDDNAADALALLSYVHSLARPEIGTARAPLFEGVPA